MLVSGQLAPFDERVKGTRKLCRFLPFTLYLFPLRLRHNRSARFDP